MNDKQIDNYINTFCVICSNFHGQYEDCGEEDENVRTTINRCIKQGLFKAVVGVCRE